MPRDVSKWLCMDCNVDTFLGDTNYYMVKDSVWLSVTDSKRGKLCIPCLETKLNRKLSAQDLTTCRLNFINPYTANILNGSN